MKKIFLIILTVVLISGISAGGNSQTNTVSAEEQYVIDNYYDTMVEVASMIDYSWRDHNNRYSNGNEIIGGCEGYALLFSLKTGADIIVANALDWAPNGIYRVVGIDETFIVNDPAFARNYNASFLYQIEYEYKPDFYMTTGEVGIYVPTIGAYTLEKISDYTPRFIGTQYAHAWNIINGVEVDINNLDDNGTWRL